MEILKDFLLFFAGYWSLIIPVPTSFYWQHQVRIEHLNMQVALLDCGGSGSSTFKAVFEAAIAETLAESRAMYGGTARGPSQFAMGVSSTDRSSSASSSWQTMPSTSSSRLPDGSHKKDQKFAEALELLESHFGKTMLWARFLLWMPSARKQTRKTRLWVAASCSAAQGSDGGQSGPRNGTYLPYGKNLKARQGQLIGNIMTPAVGKSRGF